MNKEPSYWKRYDQVIKHYSSRRLYCKILELATSLGSPYDNKQRRGHKTSVTSTEYTAYITFKLVKNGSPFRDMENDAELFFNKHIDHSTFQRNFIKIPYS